VSYCTANRKKEFFQNIGTCLWNDMVSHPEEDHNPYTECCHKWKSYLPILYSHNSHLPQNTKTTTTCFSQYRQAFDSVSWSCVLVLSTSRFLVLPHFSEHFQDARQPQWNKSVNKTLSLHFCISLFCLNAYHNPWSCVLLTHKMWTNMQTQDYHFSLHSS
jgi:hypothetical protein